MQLPAEQLVSVDIALGRSNGVYRPGDRLTGTVVIDAKQDIPLCGTGLIPSLSTGRCSRLSLRIVAARMPDCLFICLFVYFLFVNPHPESDCVVLLSMGIRVPVIYVVSWPKDFFKLL